MNWFDYLRGYEEGSYDRTSRSPGLLGSLLRLIAAVMMLAILLIWFCLKSSVKLFGWVISLFIGEWKKP